MTKVIIFDFDGTSSRYNRYSSEHHQPFVTEFGFKSATKEELAQLSNLNSWEILRYSGISLFKFPMLIRKLRSELRSEISNIQLFAGIKEVLLELKRRDFQLGIITSNSRENVLDSLENNSLQDIFTFIYSSSTLGNIKLLTNMSKKKKSILKKSFM